MRVLVTGATGFIGSHVARVLVREGCEVVALVRPGADTRRIADLLPSLTVIPADLASFDDHLGGALAAARVELCFHLAWYAVPGKYLSAPENVSHLTAGLKLVELLPRIGCRRVVGAGTCFEYDTDQGRLSEQSPIRPRTLYAASKQALASVGESLARLSGLSWAWARIFFPYGPWEDPRRLVPHVISKLTAGEPCLLTTGAQLRDYLHVEDVAEAFWAIASSPIEGAVNVGAAQPVTVAEVARVIGDLLDRPELLRLGGLPSTPGDPPTVWADNQKLLATGWRPRYELRAGLAQTVSWWQSRVA